MTARVMPQIRTYCVVLERIAFGAGETRWYVTADPRQLETLLSGMALGSAVSCYFDERIKRSTWSMMTRAQVLDLAKSTGDCVVARASAGSNRLDAVLITGEDDLDEFLSDLGADADIYFGVFPARDDDGVDAVSWVVADGSNRKNFPH